MPAGQAAVAWPRVFLEQQPSRVTGEPPHARGQGDGSPPTPVLADVDSQPSLAHLSLGPGSSRSLGAVPYPALPLLCGPRSQSSTHPSGALVSGDDVEHPFASFVEQTQRKPPNTLGGRAREYQELWRPGSSLDQGWLVTRAKYCYSPFVWMQSL